MTAVEFLCLGLWLGSEVFLSFVVAPGAFRVLAGRDQAGTLVGFALTRMHFGGLICGVTFLLARLVRTRTASSLISPTALCVTAMMLATLVSQLTVSAKMAALRVQMGSIQAADAGSPLLAEFSRLHRISVSLESIVLLTGFAGIFLLVRELPTVQ
jgi:hypothetical protein